MILYKDDWNKPENQSAIADYDTKNKSFVELALKLKMMGIENYDFMLALHIPALKGVDPFSKNLTKEQIAMIVTECKINFWYYIREVVRVPASSGFDNVYFNANRANISLYWLFFNNITTMLMQPRQTGKSLSTDILMVWIINIGSGNTTVGLLTKDDSLRTRNVARIKSLMDSLPYYLKSIRSKKDTNNTEAISINAINNYYLTEVSQADPKRAANIYRGMTIPIFHIDELAFIKNIHISLPVMLAAGNTAMTIAEKNNAPHGIIYTTTAGFLNDPSGEYAYKIYSESFRWDERLFDSKNKDELKEYIRLNSPSGKLQVLLEYNHRQLGYTDQWLLENIERSRAEGETLGADYLNIWGTGDTSVSPLDKTTLNIIHSSKINTPYTVISKQGYLLKWYVHEDEVNNRLPYRFLVLGLDTSDAIGNDGIGLVIRDAITGEVVAAGMYNECNLHSFSSWLVELLVTYNNITAIIERRSSGAAIIDHLLEILPALNIDPFRRLFNWVVQDMDIEPKYKEIVNTNMAFRPTNIYIKYKDMFGYATSGNGKSSRDNLYGTTFKHSAKYTAKYVRDVDLCMQISNLIVKNGRIDHRPNTHDDLVIGWLLGYWLLLEGRNLDVYGIPSSRVLSGIANDIIQESGGIENINKKNEQLKLKETIDNLLEQLKNETNPIKSFILSNKIKGLYAELDTNIIPPFNITAILNNIEAEKNKR